MITRYFVLSGKYTFVMYAFQSKALRLVAVLDIEGLFPDWISCLIIGILVDLIVLVISIAVERYFPWILGKQSRKMWDPMSGSASS